MRAYRKALVGLEYGLGEEFAKAIDLMQEIAGHVVVCCMGKSGIIGRKISSSLASTGTPSLFLHPAEAIHGDLGMVRDGVWYSYEQKSGIETDYMKPWTEQRARSIVLDAA